MKTLPDAPDTRTLKSFVVACSLAVFAALPACEEKAPPPMPVSPTRGLPQQPTPAPAAPANPAAAAPAATSPTPPASAATAPSPTAPAGNSFAVAGIEFRVPMGFKPLPLSSSMRAAELRAETAEGTVDVVFFAIGGDTTANIERWKGQVETAPDQPAQVTNRAVGSYKITRLKTTGSYQGMNAQGGAAPKQPNTTFLGYVIEGGRSPVQVRVTGPKNAVQAIEPLIEAMVDQMSQSK